MALSLDVVHRYVDLVVELVGFAERVAEREDLPPSLRDAAVELLDRQDELVELWRSLASRASLAL